MKSAQATEPDYKGKKLSYWLRRLDVSASDTDSKLAETAVRNIGVAAIPSLLQDLQRTHRHAQRAAVAFGFLGKDAAEAIEAIRTTPTPNPACSALALAGMGSVAFNAILSFLTHFDPKVRDAGAEGILRLIRNEQLTPEQKEACLPPLLDNSRDAYPYVRASAALTIGCLKIKSDICIPVLRSLLRTRDSLIICSAVQALGEFGKDAAPAFPELCKLAQSSCRSIRECVVTAISELSLPEAYPIVFQSLSDKDVMVRYQAFWSLGHFPERASEVVPILMEKIAADYSDPCGMACYPLWALGDLGPLAKDALPLIKKLGINPDPLGGEENFQLVISQIEGVSSSSS